MARSRHLAFLLLVTACSTQPTDTNAGGGTDPGSVPTGSSGAPNNTPGGGATEGPSPGGPGPNDPPPTGESYVVTADKTDVQTHQVVQLQSPMTLPAQATFAGKTVDLQAIAGAWAFVVPDVDASGAYQLQVGATSLSFNVTRRLPASTASLLQRIEQSDAELDSIGGMTTEELAEAHAYNQEVRELFESLSPEDQALTAAIHDANAEAVRSFVSMTTSQLDGPFTYGPTQSLCSHTGGARAFYGCTADNLGSSALEFLRAGREMLVLFGLALVGAYTSPASFGLGLFGTSLAGGTAGFIYVTELRPAFRKLRSGLWDFLGAHWILGTTTFASVQQSFTPETATNLGLTPELLNLNEQAPPDDTHVSGFVSAMSTMRGAWSDFTSWFGPLPLVAPSSTPTTIVEDIEVTDISNPNVQLLDVDGQKLTFRNTTSTPQDFTYHARVEKAGWVQDENLQGTIGGRTYACPPGGVPRTDGYRLYEVDYSGAKVQELLCGGAFRAPNYSYMHARLERDGVAVVASQRVLTGSLADFGPEDKHVGAFTISFQDAAVYPAPVLFNVDLTLGNDRYRATVGGSRSVSNGQGVYGYSMSFDADGHGTQTTPTGTGAFDWSFSLGDHYTTGCGSEPVTALGFIRLPNSYVFPRQGGYTFGMLLLEGGGVLNCPGSGYIVN